MSTYAQLTDEVLSKLHGYVRDQEQSSHLAQDVLAGDTTIQVANGNAMPGSGRVEIGDELIWADSVDTTQNTLTIPPYGRGFDSTTATTHTAGTRVISNPLFPRSVVKREINAAIQDAAGDLYAVANTQFTYTAAKLEYQLPANCNSILQASWAEIGPSRVWRPIRTWRLDQAYGEAASTGVAVVIQDPIVPGRLIQVTYARYPTVLVNDSDEFATVTGLPPTSQDVIVYGTCARLLSYVDSARVDTQSIEAGAFTQGVPVGSATNLSKQMYGMFRQRLQEERLRLLATYPTQIHYSR